ncbi:maleylpyruvate isomerase family mycothiol-dependent enzyme [soil metagenome]
MPTAIPFTRHVAAVEVASSDLASRALSSGLEAPVVTCPRWRVADLVVHQGIVHRWAASNLRGDNDVVPTKSQILKEVPIGDLLAWFEDGAEKLVVTMREVDPDVDAMVFLKDAPSPRDFWARRQAHETTIHSVDALAGLLGRMPTSAEAGIDRHIALDGVDELVCGFITRGTTKLATEEPYIIAIEPTDSDRAWTLDVGTERIVTEPTRGNRADVTFSGTATQLYLGLWNRGDEIGASGSRGALEDWRRLQRIRWS